VVTLSRLAQGSRADGTSGLYVGDIPQTKKLRPQRRGVSPDLFSQPDRHKLTILPVPGTGSSGYGSRGRPWPLVRFRSSLRRVPLPALPQVARRDSCNHEPHQSSHE